MLPNLFVVHRNSMTILFVNFRISVVARLLVHFLITKIKLYNKNLRKEGRVHFGLQFEGTQSIMAESSRQQNKRISSHISNTVRELRLNKKGGQGIKPQGLFQEIHFLQ